MVELRGVWRCLKDIRSPQDTLFPLDSSSFGHKVHWDIRYQRIRTSGPHALRHKVMESIMSKIKVLRSWEDPMSYNQWQFCMSEVLFYLVKVQPLWKWAHPLVTLSSRARNKVGLWLQLFRSLKSAFVNKIVHFIELNAMAMLTRGAPWKKPGSEDPPTLFQWSNMLFNIIPLPAFCGSRFF